MPLSTILRTGSSGPKILDLSYRSYELEEIAGQIDELKRELQP